MILLSPSNSQTHNITLLLLLVHRIPYLKNNTPDNEQDGNKNLKFDQEESHDVHSHASLILSMERTLFAALNNAWLLALGGIGLMSVGHGDQHATRGGIVVLGGGITSAMIAYGMHFLRLKQIEGSKPFPNVHSSLWAMMIASMTVVALSIEVYFGILYPYLNREKAVTIANGEV